MTFLFTSARGDWLEVDLLSGMSVSSSAFYESEKTNMRQFDGRIELRISDEHSQTALCFQSRGVPVMFWGQDCKLDRRRCHWVHQLRRLLRKQKEEWIHFDEVQWLSYTRVRLREKTEIMRETTINVGYFYRR